MSQTVTVLLMALLAFIAFCLMIVVGLFVMDVSTPGLAWDGPHRQDATSSFLKGKAMEQAKAGKTWNGNVAFPTIDSSSPLY